MNIAPDSNSDILFINFNQDYSCVSVGTANGYRIYNCDPFGKCYTKQDGGIGIVEMLFCTSLVALVGSGSQAALSPRRLQITNTKRQSIICELTFPTTILSVKLNRRRLVVLLEEQIYVYDISNMKLHHTIETAPNPSAIFAMSPNGENCYIAYPQPSTSTSAALYNNSGSSNRHQSGSSGGGRSKQHQHVSGDVVIFDANTCETITIIQAHKSGISCLCINQSGTLLATASDKGTVIRVFSIPDGTNVAQFRRGTYPAKIHSISFNANSTLLCVSSDSDTVHIFRLEDGRVSGRKKSSLSQHNDQGYNRRNSHRSIESTATTSTTDGLDHSRHGADSFGDEMNGEDDGWTYPNDSQSPSFHENNPRSPLQGYPSSSSEFHNHGGQSPTHSPNVGRKKSYGLPKSWKGLVNNKLVGKATSLMPGMLTEIWEPSRNFAFLKLPKPGVRSLVAMSSTAPQVIVVTSEGYFYQYNINLETGGECVLIKQFSLQDNSDDQAIYTS
ncbi:autophagy protein [Mycoemilia scoparia]|uniref:Autophagy-related protein 18 n=1 Tax=Mycoemilia scoparia TaxID=417184 RepID=A0A9W7ZSU7_9FUNG|nr:autophagy protein [Mycoemilia scoparia]